MKLEIDFGSLQDDQGGWVPFITVYSPEERLRITLEANCAFKSEAGAKNFCETLVNGIMNGRKTDPRQVNLDPLDPTNNPNVN